MPVPQTDAGGLAGHCRGGRVIPCQGTRQIDPVTSGEGGPRYRGDAARIEREGAAENRLKRLFTKNTGPRERDERRYAG